MKPCPILLPHLATSAFAAAFAATHKHPDRPVMLPLNHFDDVGTLSVMLSVAEAEHAELAGSRGCIALISADIRPLLALLENRYPLPRLMGLAVNYPALEAALPETAFTTHLGMVLLAAHALACPAYALGICEDIAGFQALKPD